jgi:hypothetical protein
MAKEETGLAEISKEDVALMVQAGAVESLALLREECGDIDDLPLPRVGIQAGGAKGFRAGEDATYPTLEGVVLSVQTVNAFWAMSFDEGGAGERPDCSSTEYPAAICENVEPYLEYVAALCERDTRFDLAAYALPDEKDNKLVCTACPLNVYGSHRKGRGKACKNMLRLLFWPKGAALPWQLTLPPTSKAQYQEWNTRDVGGQRLRARDLWVVLTTEATKNKEGITYSLFKVQSFAPLPPKLQEFTARMAAFWRPRLTGQPVIWDEYAGPQEESSGADAKDAD